MHSSMPVFSWLWSMSFQNTLDIQPSLNVYDEEHNIKAGYYVKKQNISTIWLGLYRLFP